MTYGFFLKLGRGKKKFQTIFGRKIKLITFGQWVRYSVPIQADRLPWKTTIKTVRPKIIKQTNISISNTQDHMCMCVDLLLTTWLPMGVTLTPVGVTMVGVTTLMAEVDGVVVVPVIFCVAAAAAARAWIPDI